MTKKSRQKLKYFENEKSFRGEINSIFISFRGLSVSKNCLRPKSAPLTLVNTDGGNERSQLQNSYWHTVYLYISLTICVKNIYFKNSLNMWVLTFSQSQYFQKFIFSSSIKTSQNWGIYAVFLPESLLYVFFDLRRSRLREICDKVCNPSGQWNLCLLLVWQRIWKSGKMTDPLSRTS